MDEPEREILPLPAPIAGSAAPLLELLAARRSRRDFGRGGIGLEALATLLWAAQGKTGDEDGRTAPSAGALYPLELYLVVGEVAGIQPGVYRYLSAEHALQTLRNSDLRASLAHAAAGQDWMRPCAAVLAICAHYARSTRKYGERGVRYVHMEVGHAVQNALLAATELGLVAAPVGAFNDEAVARLLGTPEGAPPLLLMPVGR